MKIFSFILLIVIISCGKKTIKEKPTVLARELSTLDSVGMAYYNGWESLSAKADARIEVDGRNYRTTLYIKADKDNFIWIQARKFGIEVGRALLTADSIFVINRLDNEYLAKGLDHFRNKYDMPFNYEQIQRVFSGLTPDHFYTGTTEITRNSPLHIKQKTNNYDGEFSYDSGAVIPHYLHLSDHRSSNTVKILQTGFENYGFLIWPEERKYYIKDDKKPVLELSFNKIVWNESVDYSFRIPDHYSPMD